MLGSAVSELFATGRLLHEKPPEIPAVCTAASGGPKAPAATGTAINAVASARRSTLRVRPMRRMDPGIDRPTLPLA
jgi:hypothetical protein